MFPYYSERLSYQANLQRWARAKHCTGLETGGSDFRAALGKLERTAWAERIPAERERPLAVLRVRELRILDAIGRSESPESDPTSDEVSEWSDWLQRRLADSSASPGVLKRLSRSGRTKRVRHLSGERLRALRRSS